MRGVTLLLVGVVATLGVLAKEAQATDFANYFARVTLGGAVARSSGVSAARRTGVGVYDVTFTRGVNYCGWVTSITGTTAGYATVTLKSGNVLTIRTFAPNGAIADRSFNLMVQCAP